MNTYHTISSVKNKSLENMELAKTRLKKYTILLLSFLLASHTGLKAETNNIGGQNLQISKQKQSAPSTKGQTKPIDPLILILPSKYDGQHFKTKNLGEDFTAQETPKPLLTETIGLGEKIDIYLISEDPRFERCKLVVLDPSGRALFAENIYPIEDNLGQISWSKVTLQLNHEGIYQITGQFFPPNKPPKTICNSLLVTARAKKSNATKYEPVINKELLNNILTELAYYEPPKDAQYTRANVLKIIKDFFNNDDPKKQNYRTKELELLTNWIESKNNKDNKDGARWGIQSLPAWNTSDNQDSAGNQPNLPQLAQLAQAIAKQTRPSDLSLLVELLECEIPENSKTWGLKILSDSSKSKNTEFLQAVIMEDYPEYKKQRYTNSTYSGKLKSAALEALAKTNTKSSISFLIGLYGDLSTYGTPDATEFQIDIRQNLLKYIGENKKSISALESILENEEKWAPSSLILTKQLLSSTARKP